MSSEMSEETKARRESQDAVVWAEWFVETKNACGWSLHDIDEGLMLAWFANCMMAVRDFDPHIKQLEQTIAEQREAMLEAADWCEKTGSYMLATKLRKRAGKDK